MEEDYSPLALEAVLLFHSGSPWDGDKNNKWQNICVSVLKSSYLPVHVSSFKATTKVLCDIVRAAIEQRKRFDNLPT